MKKIVWIVLISLFLCGCGATKKIATDGMKAVTVRYNSAQIDSVCVADSLLHPINKWMSSVYKDYENGIITVKYVYLKEISEEKELIYIVVPMDDTTFVLTKRYVE